MLGSAIPGWNRVVAEYESHLWSWVFCVRLCQVRWNLAPGSLVRCVPESWVFCAWLSGEVKLDPWVVSTLCTWIMSILCLTVSGEVKLGPWVISTLCTWVMSILCLTVRWGETELPESSVLCHNGSIPDGRSSAFQLVYDADVPWVVWSDAAWTQRSRTTRSAACWH